MKKRSTEEQIIGILREAERSGASIREVARKHNITDVTFYRRRNKYGGMDVPDDLRLISVADLAVGSHGSLNLGELTDEEAIYRRADHRHSA